MIQSLYVWASNKQAQILVPGSLGARFARGAFWSLMGMVITRGLGMTASIVTARLLGVTGFGEFGMINSTIGSFGIIAGLGLGLTATKYIAEYHTKDPDRAGRILGLSTQVAVISSGLISLSIFIAAPWLTANMLNAPHLLTELRMGSLLLFFNSVNGLITGALAGFEAFKTITKVSFLRGLLNFPMMIVGVWLFGLTGAVAATVVVGVVGWWLNYRALKRECARAGVVSTYGGVRTEFPVLWKFAFPAFLSGVVVEPFLWLSNALLVNQPGGYSELGLVNAANQWRAILILLPGVLNAVSLPMLSSNQEEKVEFDKTMETAQSVAMMVIVPAATVLLLLNGWIMALYGNDFAAGGSIFVSLLTGVAVSGIGSVAGPVIQATGRMWLGALMNLTWGIVFMGFTALFIPHLGGLALALGSALAYILLTAWSYVYLLSRNIVNKDMLIRVFGGVLFVIAVAFFTQIAPKNIVLVLFVPILLLSLWLSLWVWPAPFIRRRLFSISILGGRHAD